MSLRSLQRIQSSNIVMMRLVVLIHYFFLSIFVTSFIIVDSFLPSTSFVVQAQLPLVSCQQGTVDRHYDDNDKKTINQPSITTRTTTTTMAPSPPPTTLWFQHRITITAPYRGCHLITNDIMKVCQTDLSKIHIGLCNLFVQHTSASLSINENADPDVRKDLETALNKIVPESWNRDGTFLHTMEGDDDMPGHVKSSLMGVSLNIPISNGQLSLGTWQGIYLNEHRNQGGWGNGHSRHIVITLQGQTK
jgi:secondary thiamine-phosphate synthase enzyme